MTGYCGRTMLGIRQILPTAAAGLFLAGCAATPLLGVVAPVVGKQLAEMDWFIGPAPEMRAEPVRYCYGTLGQVECLNAPVAGEDSRLIGFAGPPPAGRLP